MQTLDWVMIGGYFTLLLGVAWWVVSRSKNTAADYFLAGRNLSWWIVGASIFASNIGSEHVVGLAGSGAKDGVAMAHYELHAWCLLMLAWVFVPFYARSLVFTMPEFLEKRFSIGSRYVLSIVSLITFVVSKIAVGIFAGGVVFGALLPELQIKIGATVIDSFWIGSVAVIVLTGLYTVLGGMRAVAYNDAMQTIVLICGSATLTIYGLSTLGDGSLASRLVGIATLLRQRHVQPLEALDPAGYGGHMGTGQGTASHRLVLQQQLSLAGHGHLRPVIGLWYWCTDQYIVQRALGAPDEKTARRGSIFAAFLKLFPVYLFIIPGLIFFALASSGKVPDLTEGKAVAAQAQAAFPMLVKHLLPAGLRGIVVAGLLSALMGSLAGVFNACSTLFTVDLYEKWKPKATQQQIVQTGRIATAVMVAIALAWIPVVKGANSLYEYLQSIQGYLAPPIFVVFFFGVFFKRLNAKGCFWSMIVGFIVGVFRMLVDTPVTMKLPGFEKGYAEGSFLWIVNNINFQYFSILITIVSAVVMVVVSYMTAPPPAAQIQSLTFGTSTADDKRKTRASWDWRGGRLGLRAGGDLGGVFVLPRVSVGRRVPVIPATPPPILRGRRDDRNRRAFRLRCDAA